MMGNFDKSSTHQYWSNIGDVLYVLVIFLKKSVFIQFWAFSVNIFYGRYLIFLHVSLQPIFETISTKIPNIIASNFFDENYFLKLPLVWLVLCCNALLCLISLLTCLHVYPPKIFQCTSHIRKSISSIICIMSDVFCSRLADFFLQISDFHWTQLLISGAFKSTFFFRCQTTQCLRSPADGERQRLSLRCNTPWVLSR